VKHGQVVADLGCGLGYYTLALARCVGPEGQVYAVDLDEKSILSLKKKVDKERFHNIDAHASSASALGFIKDKSVDFVLANGLLCSMAGHRQEAVNEIKRIMKPSGQAYLSLGAFPPFGLVDRTEWDKILEGFRIEQRGVRWALVKVV
jgi:ubiquinone/menaquinone biosynthesis C-methylase UbiE